MTVPVLADPGPERARGPRSRALRTCPNAPGHPAQTDPGTAAAADAWPAPPRPSATEPGEPPDPTAGPRHRAHDGPTGREQGPGLPFTPPGTRAAAVLGSIVALALSLSSRGFARLRGLDRGMSTVDGIVGADLAAVPAPRTRPWSRGRSLLHRARLDDRGMSTVEYAIGTLAAAAFAAVLYTVVSGDSVVAALTGLVQRALQVAF